MQTYNKSRIPGKNSINAVPSMGTGSTNYGSRQKNYSPPQHKTGAVTQENYNSPETTNYMYMRNKDNRSGVSLDVVRRGGYNYPQVQQDIAGRANSKDARLGLQYNSTSIPYIYKVGG